MIAVMAVEVLLLAVKPGTLSLPLVARPIAVLELVQLKDVPARLLLKAAKGIVVPAQTVKLAGTVTAGNGFTVMV